MTTETISKQLAKFIHALSFEELPDDVVDEAKMRLLDALSTGIAAHDFPCPRLSLDLVKGNKGEATVFMHGHRLPAIDAAFVNGNMVQGLGQDDAFLASHPASVIVPATIAIAEEQGSTGEEAITALVAGYDLMARTYSAAPTIAPRFRPTPVFGPFGAAAAAGKLLRLDEDQLTSALGLAANFSSGFTEGWTCGTTEIRLQPGIASRNGIMAALLARAGGTAAETTLEGEYGFYKAFAGTDYTLDPITTDLGKIFLIKNTKSKQYPI